MTSLEFDPFMDRMARDIRNNLSGAFVRALALKEPEYIQRAVDSWLAADLPPVYRVYIQDRIRRYRRVFESEQFRTGSDPLSLVVPIWNEHLFFEVHDQLEMLWQETSGEKREAVKGMIKAAAAHIHREYGHQDAMVRLCDRSVKLLAQHGHSLKDVFNIDLLIDRLKRKDPVPPKM